MGKHAFALVNSNNYSIFVELKLLSNQFI